MSDGLNTLAIEHNTKRMTTSMRRELAARKWAEENPEESRAHQVSMIVTSVTSSVDDLRLLSREEARPHVRDLELALIAATRFVGSIRAAQ